MLEILFTVNVFDILEPRQDTCVVNDAIEVTFGHCHIRNVPVGHRNVVTTRQSTLVGILLRLSC